MIYTNNKTKNYSLLVIKPDAVKRELESEIVKILKDNNFIIRDRKKLIMTEKDIMILYHESREEKHFSLLIEYLNGETIIALRLEKENCVGDLNTIVGQTDPQKAAKGTIRSIFGIDILKNSVHSSNDNRVDIELELIFNK